MPIYLEVLVLIIATSASSYVTGNLCEKAETTCCHVNEFCGQVELFGRICSGLPRVCKYLESKPPSSSISSANHFSTSKISISSSTPFEESSSIEESVSIEDSTSSSSPSSTIIPSSSRTSSLSSTIVSTSLSKSWPTMVTSAITAMPGTVCPYSTHHILYTTASLTPWWSSYNVPEAFREWLLKDVQKFAKCHYGTKFCALNQKCIPNHENCTIHLTNDMLRNLTSTPWCTKCSPGKFFCPSYMQCIGVNETCSYEDLFQWQKNKNSSIGLFGIVCGANETFCIETLSCIPNTTACEKEIDYVASREKAEISCKQGEKFCPYTSSCQNVSDCKGAPSRNYTLQDDYLGGWAHLCQMQNLICPAVSHAVVKCAEARDKFDCNFCPDGHAFCKGNGLCQEEGKPCCSQGEEKCDFSNSCSTPSQCKNYSNLCELATSGYMFNFTFEVNFSAIQGNVEGFKKNITEIIINATRVSCIADINASPGSINVSFILVPTKGQALEDFQQSVSALQRVIESGNFIVTLPSGQPVTANAVSLTVEPVTPLTTPPPTTTSPTTTSSSPKPTDSDASNENLTVIIVCSVVFGLLFLVIIGVIAYCIIKRKKQSGRISPTQSQHLKDADQDSLEMRGRYRKVDHPDSNYNRALKTAISF